MISKYLQIQLFYFVLIFILPYVISYFKPLSDTNKGHLAAGMSVVCVLLWVFVGKNMIEIKI